VYLFLYLCICFCFFLYLYICFYICLFALFPNTFVCYQKKNLSEKSFSFQTKILFVLGNFCLFSDKLVVRKKDSLPTKDFVLAGQFLFVFQKSLLSEKKAFPSKQRFCSCWGQLLFVFRQACCQKKLSLPNKDFVRAGQLLFVFETSLLSEKKSTSKQSSCFDAEFMVCVFPKDLKSEALVMCECELCQLKVQRLEPTKDKDQPTHPPTLLPTQSFKQNSPKFDHIGQIRLV